MKIPPPSGAPEDLTPRRCEVLASEADDRRSRHGRSEARRRARTRRRRLRKLVAGLYALTACPTFVAGLWATGEYGSSWYGVAGVVLAVACLWWSEVLGRWMP